MRKMVKDFILQLYDGIYATIRSALKHYVGGAHSGSKGRSLHFQLRTWSHLEPPALLFLAPSLHSIPGLPGF